MKIQFHHYKYPDLQKFEYNRETLMQIRKEKTIRNNRGLLGVRVIGHGSLAEKSGLKYGDLLYKVSYFRDDFQL